MLHAKETHVLPHLHYRERLACQYIHSLICKNVSVNMQSPIPLDEWAVVDGK